MKVLEMTFTVSQAGNMKIPAKVIREMGLVPGDHVRVAFLTQDGSKNTFHEFYLSKDGIAASGENSIMIPNELLAQAEISDADDIQLLCMDGYLVLCRDSGMSLEELSAVLESLQYVGKFTELSPSELEAAQMEIDELSGQLKEEQV